MSKVRIFFEIAPNIASPEVNFYELYYSTFEKSELGRIKKLLPLREMADNFGLVRKSMMPKLGRKSFFTPEGKVALMHPEDVQEIVWGRSEKGRRRYGLRGNRKQGLLQGERDTERVLRSLEGQGQDESDENPLHLLRYPHGKCGPAGGQDRTKGAFGGGLTPKLAVNAEFLWGNCILAMKNRQKTGRNDRKQI